MKYQNGGHYIGICYKTNQTGEKLEIQLPQYDVNRARTK